MSTFFEKLVRVLSLIVEYLWKALKAIGRAVLWVFRKILQALSGFITWARYNLSGRAQTILLAIIVALIVVGVALVFTGRGCVSCSQETSEEPTVEVVEPPAVTYTPNELDVQKLKFTPDTITSFSLVESGNQMYAPLSEADNKAISDALAIYKKNGDDIGFLILNLDSGSGYCYNIDTRIYGASTYKGPLATFLCEEYIDAGTMKRSAVSNRIENSIIWSDNDSYRSLKHGYDGSDQRNWLYSMGIDPSNFSATFPTYSVRDSATLWMHIWKYLNSGTETATWLKGLFGKTETSFLRQGVTQAGMTNALVYNKAGWCVSSNEMADAVNDAGIVVDGDQTYLVVAFSSAADGPTAEANLANVFEALMSVRHDLDATNATWDNVEVVEASSDTGDGDGNNDGTSGGN